MEKTHHLGAAKVNCHPQDRVTSCCMSPMHCKQLVYSSVHSNLKTPTSSSIPNATRTKYPKHFHSGREGAEQIKSVRVPDLKWIINEIIFSVVKGKKERKQQRLSFYPLPLSTMNRYNTASKDLINTSLHLHQTRTSKCVR